MSNQEILEKAIQKAISEGLDFKAMLKDIGYYLDTKPKDMTHWQDFIYRKDFAKALWGDGNRIQYKRYGILNEAWKVHLQMMVIAADPIKYLGENI